jgi:oligosaccharide repeat unit polymerase
LSPDLIDTLLAFCFSIGMLLNAYTMRSAVGVWLFPACIYSLFWFLMTMLPLVVGYGVQINSGAVAFIFATTVAVSLGSLPFAWRHAFRMNENKPDPARVFRNGFMRSVLYGSSFVALGSAVAEVMSQGFSLSDLVTNTFEVAGTYAGHRYSGEVQATIFSRLGLACAYLAVLSGGLYYGIQKAGGKLILVASFLPALVVMVLQSAKGLFFLSAALFFGGILVIRVYRGEFYIFRRNDLTFLMKSGLVVVPLLIVSFLSRGLHNAGDSEYVFRRLATYLVSYSSGHLYAFSDWFASYLGMNSQLRYANGVGDFGYYTFKSLFEITGAKWELPPGIYGEYLEAGEFIVSNIFTAFRGAILDFGLIGTIIFAFMSGLIAHLFYYFLLKTRRPTISIAVFVFFVGAVYMSYIISILTWTVIPFVLVVFSLILIMNDSLFLKARN